MSGLEQRSMSFLNTTIWVALAALAQALSLLDLERLWPTVAASICGAIRKQHACFAWSGAMF